MATLSKSNTTSVDGNSLMRALIINVTAGSTVKILEPTYVDSNGKAQVLVSGSASMPYEYAGFCVTSGSTFADNPINVARGFVAGYSTGMTPGAALYISASAGVLQTTAVYSGQPAVGLVLSSTEIVIW
jgi:hypothetical protein